MPQNRIWLFDLDNTLHNASPHIFPHINRAMTQYLMRHLALSQEAANALRVQYWRRYGATMLGLVRHHGTDPDHFLHVTHEFPDLPRMLVFERALDGLLRRLPGRKVVFSNGPQAYAERVLGLTGLRRRFEAVMGVEQMGYHPKPQRRAYLAALRSLRVPAAACVLVEDTLENLRTAHAMGMKTVWVSRQGPSAPWVSRRIGSILDLPSCAGLARYP